MGTSGYGSRLVSTEVDENILVFDTVAQIIAGDVRGNIEELLGKLVGTRWNITRRRRTIPSSPSSSLNVFSSLDRHLAHPGYGEAFVHSRSSSPFGPIDHLFFIYSPGCRRHGSEQVPQIRLVPADTWLKFRPLFARSTANKDGQKHLVFFS
ncbi:hypothetical protein GALMADRAFT_1217935 [Galerina marginata CBS 339.88]|uniref:Uncharacterized protein n=1 Tax=Galerina marginata (strain CBS 339.88) TaxID=685588 RepID=A0A067S4V2_GALM3|nr:hypothetical protein GALMADRAFT_1217935 [Galerina marginata CBS 339.88]